MFVELHKNEDDYTSTTMYQDRVVSERVFHWESQSTCHPGTDAGRRYLAATKGGSHSALLFARAQRSDARKIDLPYLFLGRGFLIKTEGARPMRIDWELEHRVPAWFWAEHKVAAG